MHRFPKRTIQYLIDALAAAGGPPYYLYADGEAAPRNRFLKYVDLVDVALRGRIPSGEGEEFEVDYA